MMASSKTGIEEVSGNSNAIFYAGLGYVTDEVKTLQIKKTDTDVAISPSSQTVKDGSYPIARPLFFYTNGQPQGAVKAFIDWAMGPAGQKIVTELDFVTIN
jgi:phosphate transport system substrate-binding protein